MDNKKEATIIFRSEKGNSYVYDAVTNLVFPDQSGFSEIIADYRSLAKDQVIDRYKDRYPAEDIAMNYDYIDTLVRDFHAFYFNGREAVNRGIESPDELDGYLSNMKHIVLEVTQSCNLRCKYCIFSGSYEDFRSHDNQFMKEGVAYRALDHYFSFLASDRRTKKIDRAFINFYGGEPLLNFELIKKAVDYARRKYREKEIKDVLHFTMSSNGMLVRDDILDYLVENEFLLALSLDGPREEHDKNRVTPAGEGSFDRVWGNIKAMIERYPEYARSHVVFLVTLNPNHDPLKIEEFFRHVFNDGYSRLKIALLRDGNYGEEQKEFREKISELRKEIFKNKSLDLSFSPFLETFLGPLYDLYRKKNALVTPVNLTATCYPDDYRFFVACNGEYHMCERINPGFAIGNYIDGFQIKKVKKIYEAFNDQVVKKKCAHCIARNFCTICFASAASGSRFEVGELCLEQVKMMKGIIQDVIDVYEGDSAGFLNPGQKTQQDRLLNEAFY